jgi:mannosyltransferase
MADLTAPTARASAHPIAAAPAALRQERVRAQALDWLVVVVPALAELLVGGYQIGQPTLWRDEAYTRSVVQRPLGDIVAMLAKADAVHGLYYVVMHPLVAVLGTSVTAIRLPSLVATSLAAGVTAALGRRLANAAGRPSASMTGLLAGLLLVAMPLTTWYAQDARPYAMATLCAVGATYFLVRGMTAPSRWWWAGYAAAIAVLAMLNLAALLLVAAHGVSVYVLRGRTSTATTAVTPRVMTRRWLVASAAAIVALSPLIVFAVRQNSQINWVRQPGLENVFVLVADFSGYQGLIPLMVPLVLLGIAADLGRRCRQAWTPAAITLPWLMLTPAALLTVSAVVPVYVERYVIFCMPAMALLAASGMIWLAAQARLTSAGRRFPALAGLVPAVLLIVIAAALVHPQHAIRTSGARLDDLASVAAVVAAHEQPGDVIFYMPWNTQVVALAYPGPFAKLRNIGLGRSAVASATLEGVRASAPALASRFTRVRRLWTVRWTNYLTRPSHTPVAMEQARLISQMVQVHQWTIRTLVLTLYQARSQSAEYHELLGRPGHRHVAAGRSIDAFAEP